MSNEPVILFRDFGFQYYSQAEPTLFNINLAVYPGEKILIAGPSGSGKTTLGCCLNGLIPFSYKGTSSGSLSVFGKAVSEQSIFQISKKTGTVLQDSDSQFVGLTAGEDIAFALENQCTAAAEMRERVRNAARLVDMDRFLTSLPSELSGGQKQRTALAGIMIDDVEVLLFDEPLANLDPATGRTAIEIIDEIHHDSGKTIIIIEHRLEDVLHRFVDRIIVMNEGRVIADRDPDHLLCTDILTKTGLREPLYVTALKYAGVRPESGMKPGRIDTLDVTNAAGDLRRWIDSIQPAPVPPPGKTILRVEHLSFSYEPGKEVLHDVSFAIDEGEMVSIVGRNGAGKTTITKLLCGFEQPSAGDIFYRNENIQGHTIRERAEYIGLVMQNPNQMISETMIENEVALGLKLRKTGREETEARVRKALEICGLAPFRHWPISALSFGQKKRVTVASMLVLEPKILVLDEPTAGQDYRHYTEIMNFLRALNERGVAIILITHDMHLMLEYTPRAVVLSEGQLVRDAPSWEILTSEEIIGRANLKETSLYTLARKAGIKDAAAYVHGFINFERQQGGKK